MNTITWRLRVNSLVEAAHKVGIYNISAMAAAAGVDPWRLKSAIAGKATLVPVEVLALGRAVGRDPAAIAIILSLS